MMLALASRANHIAATKVNMVRSCRMPYALAKGMPAQMVVEGKADCNRQNSGMIQTEFARKQKLGW